MLDYKAGVLLKQKGSCGIWVLGSELTICSFRAGGVLGMCKAGRSFSTCTSFVESKLFYSSLNFRKTFSLSRLADPTSFALSFI